MDATELLGIFREEVSDKVAPYLWSDALVYAYIDDAQKQFCRETYGIQDARTFTIPLVVNTEWYDIDKRILQILGIYDSRGSKLHVVTRDEANALHVRFDGTKGKIDGFVKGLEKNALRAFPIPNTAETLTMEVLRLPVTIEAGDEFEIDEKHILNLLLWVKHKAYGMQDTETYDPVKSADYKQAFKAYCDDSRIEDGRLTRNVAVVKFRDM